MKGNLLILDDERALSKILGFQLQDLVDKVYVSDSALEALDLLKENEIHCIVCDVNMPKMTGMEFVKVLRDEKNNVPVIFYSGHGNYDLMVEAIQLNAFDFFNKPSFDGLEHSVSCALKQGLNIQQGNSQLEFELKGEYRKLLKKLTKL